MSKPIPIDLTRHAAAVEGAREFLRLWMRPDGAMACFVNPVPVGPDPAAFGAALAETIEHAARTYARATGIGEAEAAARIREGMAETPSRPMTDEADQAALPTASATGKPLPLRFGATPLDAPCNKDTD